MNLFSGVNRGYTGDSIVFSPGTCLRCYAQWRYCNRVRWLKT